MMCALAFYVLLTGAVFEAVLGDLDQRTRVDLRQRVWMLPITFIGLMVALPFILASALTSNTKDRR